MNASLDNHMAINAASAYEAQNLAVTAEEEEAMEKLERDRKQQLFKDEMRKSAAVNPATLKYQLVEAIQDAGSGFDVFLHDAFKTDDECLIGKLIKDALFDYRTTLAAKEVGLKVPALLRSQAS